MKYKKATMAVVVSAGLAVMAVIGIKMEPFKAADFMPLIKFAVMIALSVFSWFMKKKEDVIKGSRLGVLFSVAYKLFLLLAGLAMLEKGFDCYRENAYWKTLFFTLPGAALIFTFFFTAGGEQETYPGTRSAQELESGSVPVAAMKITVAFALAFIAVWFLKIEHWVLADIAFTAAIIQLMLVFKRGVLVADSEAGAGERVSSVIGKVSTLVMVAAAFYLFYLTLVYVNAYDFKSAVKTFIFASALLALAPVKPKEKSVAPDKMELFDYLFMGVVFILSIRIFTWDLSGVPPGIHGDECLFIRLARSILNGAHYDIFIPNEEINSATLNFFLIALIGKVFGLGIVTARSVSIIFSAIMVTGSYAFFRSLFNRTAAMITALFSATFFMTLLYSRIAISWMHVPMLGLLGYYCFYLALKKGSMPLYVLSGVFTGLAMYFYNAGKMVPFFFPVFILLAMIDAGNRRSMLSNWKGLVMLALAAVVIYLPMINYITFHPQVSFGRVSKVSLIHHIPPTSTELSNVMRQFVSYVQMFFTRSANGYCHNLPQKPFFDGIVGYFAIAGGGYLLSSWRKMPSLFVMSWLLVGIAPGFLSTLGPEDPFPSRVVLAIPVIMLTIALGMERLMSWLENLWRNIFRWVSPAVYVYVAACFVFMNFNNFFVMFKKDPHTVVYYRAAERTVAMAMEKGYKDTIFMVSPMFWDDYYFGTAKHLSGVYLEKIFDRADVSVLRFLPLLNPEHRNECIVGEGLYYKSFQIYKEYYPDAYIKIVWDPNFWQFDKTSSLKYCYEWANPDAVIDLNLYYRWFYLYDPTVPFVSVVLAYIPYKDIESLSTPDAATYLKGNFVKTVKANDNSINFDGTFDRAVINGLIEIPDYKKYQFELENGAGNIYIDGRKASEALLLYEGLHRIKVEINRQGVGTVAMKWKAEGQADFTDITKGSMLNSDKIFGLLAEYRTTEGKLLHVSLEHDIQQRMYWPLPRPVYLKNGRKNDYNVRWKGFIDMHEEGKYRFRFDTAYTAKVTIDGRVVYEKPLVKNKDEKIYEIYLTKGPKPITIDAYYSYTDKYWYETATMRFLYKSAKGSIFGPVTYDMLKPGI